MLSLVRGQRPRLGAIPVLPLQVAEDAMQGREAHVGGEQAPLAAALVEPIAPTLDDPGDLVNVVMSPSRGAISRKTLASS
jgi:hypothetical protein